MQLHIEHAGPGGRTIRLWTVENPPITSPLYALLGRIRHEQVEGTAYLEMWSVFAGGERYFSRTLQDSGPAAGLTGASGWREICVPFFNRKGGPAPQSLELNLVLPGPGSVWLDPIRLVQFGTEQELIELLSGGGSVVWADWLGLGLGVGLGLGGGLIGLLAGLGRARRLALGLAWTLLGAGVVLLGTGLVALVRTGQFQPAYPLLLSGGIAVAVVGANLGRLRRRYQEVEQRRMRALDVS
jgi:hypothetical protein